MFAGSSAVVLLMSGSARNDNISATQTQPEPTCKTREELEVWQLTHLEKTLASGSTEEGMGCSIKIIIMI